MDNKQNKKRTQNKINISKQISKTKKGTTFSFSKSQTFEILLQLFKCQFPIPFVEVAVVVVESLFKGGHDDEQ